ncbi:MAG: hypothetical protein RMJ56_01670 [Gemmataceae bacterium]|nr:general stress protein [Gemmata sp.]MDW8196291.1 hypothetical protein [Gemmataceae bacterium]
MWTSNSTTVIGVFSIREEMEQAIRELRAAGFSEDSIGMISRDPEGRLVSEGGGQTLVSEGAAAGAVVGASAGALVGWGMVSGTIPVIGPVLALGTLGTILVNAAGGATILGIVGALVGLGIPEDEAKFYEAEVQGGRFLVTVDARDRQTEAWTILNRSGGYNHATQTHDRSNRPSTSVAN